MSSTNAQPIMFDDEELLFDDDLLVSDGTVDQLDDIDLDDGPIIIDKAALLRRDVWHGLVHCIVSNAKLWATVDVAEVKALMDGPLAALPEQPLSLAPLWTYMIKKGTPRSAAAETLVFFHSRAARWHVSMVLPREIDEVAEERRNVVVGKMSARGVTTGTFIGANPLLPEAERAAQAKKRANAKKHAASAVKSSRFVTNVVRICLGLSFVVALAALSESFVPNVEDRAAAALGSVCTSVAQQGHAVRCVTDVARLEGDGEMNARVELAEAALDVSIVFVNAAGEPLALVSQPRGPAAM